MSEKFGREYLERLAREKADARKLADAEERTRQAEADRAAEEDREAAQKTEELLTFCKRECEGFSFPDTGHVLQVATAPGSVLLGVPPDPRGYVALRVEDHTDSAKLLPITLALLRFYQGGYQMVTFGPDRRDFPALEDLQQAVMDFLAGVTAHFMEQMVKKAKLRGSLMSYNG